MKHLFFSLFLLLFSTTGVYSQTKELDQDMDKYIDGTSNFALSRRGPISVREFFDTGDFKKIKYQVVQVNNLDAGTSFYYGRFRFVSQDLKKGCIGILTEADIEACIKLLTFSKNSLLPTIPNNPKECEYIGESKTRLIVFRGEKNWVVGLYSYAFDDNMQQQYKEDDIDNILTQFKQMKDMINKLKN